MSPYATAWEITAKTMDNWEDWFNPDIPTEQAYPSTPMSWEVAEEMLENGKTEWGHPGWIAEVLQTFEHWAIAGHLIKVRLIADSLLASAPANPLDPDVLLTLAILAKGDFCDAYAGSCSTWPGNRDKYRLRLQWHMDQYCIESLLSMGCSRWTYRKMEGSGTR